MLEKAPKHCFLSESQSLWKASLNQKVQLTASEQCFTDQRTVEWRAYDGCLKLKIGLFWSKPWALRHKCWIFPLRHLPPLTCILSATVFATVPASAWRLNFYRCNITETGMRMLADMTGGSLSHVESIDLRSNPIKTGGVYLGKWNTVFAVAFFLCCIKLWLGGRLKQGNSKCTLYGYWYTGTKLNSSWDLARDYLVHSLHNCNSRNWTYIKAALKIL